MSSIRTRSVLAALTGLLFSSGVALAADGQAFAERLKAVMAPSTRLEFGAVSNEGDDVVMNDARVTPAQGGSEPFDLGTLRFENVTGSNADGWRVARVQLGDIRQTSGDVATNVSNAILEGLTIRPDTANTAVLSPLFLERSTIGSISVAKADRSVVSVNDISVVTQPSEGEGLASSIALGKFTFDTAATGNAGLTQVMADLGYAQLTGSLQGAGSWQPQTGALSLSDLKIAVENAGQLNLAYTITGYTPNFIQSLSQVSQQLEASDGQNQNAGMAVIGLISQLYLQSATLAFEDQSLTNRVLDYFAKQNGQPREQFVETVKATVPLGLAYLQNPTFQAQVGEAVNDFLDNPRSIRLAIEPPAPIPATQILGAAMGAPQTLPQVLNLSVQSGR
ncbi:hypothetical protein [Aureimonas jatrophae]|uniref:Uncharacterized protein n=1 Tax=Aureimonas jatrophae TaxID=1166073 RepID=A0A1H0GSP6_9HYPH|nr:hypothetical protein [Aureimonas jatrophae]MBB3949755.1 hypothetical protein [Aureimonas jatrophae]SDO09923.1 hypothetical protein SAMN05192530_103307 [Aureimonas jatrophae]